MRNRKEIFLAKGIEKLVLSGIPGSTKIVTEEKIEQIEAVLSGPSEVIGSMSVGKFKNAICIEGEPPEENDEELVGISRSQQIGCNDLHSGSKKKDISGGVSVIVTVPRRINVKISEITGNIEIDDVDGEVQIDAGTLKQGNITVGKVGSVNIAVNLGTVATVAGVSESAIVGARYDSVVTVHSKENPGNFTELVAFAESNGRIAYFGSAEKAYLTATDYGYVYLKGEAGSGVLFAGENGEIKVNKARRFVKNRAPGGSIYVGN